MSEYNMASYQESRWGDTGVYKHAAMDDGHSLDSDYIYTYNNLPFHKPVIYYYKYDYQGEEWEYAALINPLGSIHVYKDNSSLRYDGSSSGSVSELWNPPASPLTFYDIPRFATLEEASAYSANLKLSGGAGSGYIGNSLLSNKKMVGYNVPTSSAEGTKTESVNEVSVSAVSGKPKSGNGHARIKFLGEPQYDTWIDGKRIYVEELNLSNPSLFQEISVSIANLDIDTVISISGTYNSLKSTYGNYWYKFPYYQDDNHRSFMRLESENGNYVRLVYRINLGNNEGNSTSKQIFRILYTKKTEV